MEEKRVNIFEYTNYRTFLKDWRLDRESQGKPASYRWLSSRAGFSSPNFFKLVIEGQRNLTSKSTPQVLKALSLKGKEARYFELMVLFNQAKSAEQKKQWAEKLSQLQSQKIPSLLAAPKYEFYNEWYIPVVREVILNKGNIKDPVDVLEFIRPQIKRSQAIKAFEVLSKLKLIEYEKKTSTWKPTSEQMTTGDEVSSVAIFNFQKTMIEHAVTALDRFSADNRDISSLTLNLTSDKFFEAKKMLQDFRKKLLQLEVTEQPNAEVVQVNFQLYPLTESGSVGDE